MGDNKYQSTAKLNKLEYQLLLIRFNAHMGPSENSSGQKKKNEALSVVVAINLIDWLPPITCHYFQRSMQIHYTN